MLSPSGAGKGCGEMTVQDEMMVPPAWKYEGPPGCTGRPFAFRSLRSDPRTGYLAISSGLVTAPLDEERRM
jgi:hypothetical protein